jgi:hypothetical protein
VNPMLKIAFDKGAKQAVDDVQKDVVATLEKKLKNLNAVGWKQEAKTPAKLSR